MRCAAIQGLGSGGSMSVTDIIFADMVPLPERGKFQGIAAAYVFLLMCEAKPLLIVLQTESGH